MKLSWKYWWLVWLASELPEAVSLVLPPVLLIETYGEPLRSDGLRPFELPCPNVFGLNGGVLPWVHRQLPL